jgi:hypothetical protein
MLHRQAGLIEKFSRGHKTRCGPIRKEEYGSRNRNKLPLYCPKYSVKE